MSADAPRTDGKSAFEQFFENQRVLKWLESLFAPWKKNNIPRA